MAEESAAPAAAPRHPGRIQISNKKPLYFYVGLGKRLLGEHGEIQLSALGFAVSTMVTVAELLKKEKLCTEKKLCTSLEPFTDDGKERQVHKPKLEITLSKSADYDSIMAEAARLAAEREAAKAAAAAPPAAPQV